MKALDLKGKTIDQLKEIIIDSKKELMNLRFQLSSSSLKNTSRIKVVKRRIARVMTIFNSKEQNF